MHTHKNEPQIYGYIYEWGDGEDLPANAQEERIRQRAAEIDGRWVECHADRPVAGKTIPFHERPEARKLCMQLQRDDWLIVWKIDAFGDSLQLILEALRPIGVRGVNVWILTHGRRDLKVVAEYSETFQKLLAPVAEVESERISRRTRAAMQFRKKIGAAYARRPTYGKMRSHHRGFEGEVLKMDHHHDCECAQIREITLRRDCGETFTSIGADFLHRRERKADRKLWVRKPRKGKPINTCRIRRAYHYHKSLLAAGKDLYGLPVDNNCGQPSSLAASSAG